jgi:hypothetical protein
MQRFLLKDMLFSNDCPCKANCASLAGTGNQLHMMCVANQGTEDSVARVILRQGQYAVVTSVAIDETRSKMDVLDFPASDHQRLPPLNFLMLRSCFIT